MESSPSSSSPSTVIDFEGKRKLLTTVNNKFSSMEQRRPLDSKRKKFDTTNHNEMNDDVRQAIRQTFLTIEPRRIRSKIPIRQSPKQRSTTSKIPVRISPSKKGAFRFIQTQENLSTDDDDEQLKEEDLKKKFREEKQQRKRKGQLLDQLQENYNDLLEKYAQAENTIDQLRFQPKIGETNSSTEISEFSTRKYPSINETPLSSIRPLASSSTIVTPQMVMTQNVSPGQSINREDETIVEEDLLNQSRTCGGKMKTFLTLMDANQLSLVEQKQAYETIRHDYQRLLQAYNERTNENENQRTDLNEELSNMKQLLKDIVKQMTEDLVEKSLNSSRSDRVAFPSPPRPSSQISVRSSLCNQNELIDQYQKILSVVNTVPTHSNEQQQQQQHDQDEKKGTFDDISVSQASTSHDRTTPTPFSLGGLEFETIGERSSDGMIQLLVKQDDVEEKTFPSSRRFDSELISNVSSHSSSAASSESLTSQKSIIHSSKKKSTTIMPMLTTTQNQRRYGNSMSTDDQLHRSTHTWRPEKTHRAYLRSVTSTTRSRPTVTYRSSLYIEPKRTSNVVVPSRFTTIFQQRHFVQMPSTHRRQNLIDDAGYESESVRSSRNRTRHVSTSSSYSDDSDFERERIYRREINLNEAFARAEQIELESRRLATSIRRMLKMFITVK